VRVKYPASVSLPCKRISWEAQAGETRLSIYGTARELLEFMRDRKKLWLLPIVTVLVLLGGLLVLAEGSALAPFIYSIF